MGHRVSAKWSIAWVNTNTKKEKWTNWKFKNSFQHIRKERTFSVRHHQLSVIAPNMVRVMLFLFPNGSVSVAGAKSETFKRKFRNSETKPWKWRKNAFCYILSKCRFDWLMHTMCTKESWNARENIAVIRINANINYIDRETSWFVNEMNGMRLQCTSI